MKKEAVERFSSGAKLSFSSVEKNIKKIVLHAFFFK